MTRTPNPRIRGRQRILAKDVIELTPGELPGIGPTFRLFFADADTGAEAEVYLTLHGSMNLAGALQTAIHETLGISVVGEIGTAKTGGALPRGRR